MAGGGIILATQQDFDGGNVYEGEMGEIGKLGDEELDRLLGGGVLPPDEGVDEVGQFVRQLRAAFSEAPRPEVEASHLRAIMQSVREAAENGDSHAVAGAESGGEAGTSRWKKLGLRGAAVSLALKIVGGAAALAASAGGLASIEALPGPAQQRVASAIEAVTPFDLPGNQPQAANVSKEKDDRQTEQIRPNEPPAPVPNPNADFGQDVAGDARDGGVEGAEVSGAARQQAEERRNKGPENQPEKVKPAVPGHVPGPPEGAGSASAGKGPSSGGPQNGLARSNGNPGAGQGPKDGQPGPPAGPRANR